MTFYFPNKPIRVYDPTKILGLLNPVESWVAQPKWNGKRVEISCDADGKITLFGRLGQRFPERWPWLSDLPLARPWFVDGELLRDNRIYVWDFAVLGGEPVFRDTYEPRLRHLEKCLPNPLTVNGQTVACVEVIPAQGYKSLLLRRGDKMLEGIVWKSLRAKNLWGPHATTEVNSQFKYRF